MTVYTPEEILDMAEGLIDEVLIEAQLERLGIDQVTRRLHLKMRWLRGLVEP